MTSLGAIIALSNVILSCSGLDCMMEFEPRQAEKIRWNTSLLHLVSPYRAV